MKVRSLFAICGVLAICLGIALTSHAQHPRSGVKVKPAWSERIPPPISIPEHPLWPPVLPARLSIDSVHVNTTIDNGVAQSNVEQVWRNDTDRAQEGSYLFPVPEGATLSDFALYDGDKKLSARLLDPDQARDTYENIVRHLRDPALLRYVGRSAYEVRLYPVAPHATRRVTLRYTEILRSEGGDILRYACPLASDAAAGEPPGQMRPRSVSVQVSLNDSQPLANIYSPSHDISVHRHGDHKADVSWEAQDARVGDEFTLYYSRTAHDPIGLSLITYNVSLPQPGNSPENLGVGQRDAGTFMVMATPKTELLDTQIMPKRVVLVLDRSGSMSGPKIEQAKGALSYVLQNLRASDQFNVMTFSDSNDILAPGKLLSASPDNIKRALAFVRDISAAGGTDINDALDAGMRLIPETEEGSRYQNMVIFLTDGLPTVGETDQSHIVDHARGLAQARNVRLFNFGVGYDVDVHFLDRLARENHGDADYVRPEENIEAKVSRFYTKVASPVLADLHLQIEGVRTADILPRSDELPDLFAGSQLVVMGRYTGSGSVTVRLTGLVNGKKTAYTLVSPVGAVMDHADFLPRLWATRKVGYLLDAIRLRETDPGEAGKAELVNEIVRISKEYGIITPYTSFLVTDDTERSGGQPPLPMMLPQDMAAPSGANATTSSQAFRSMKAATVAPAAPPEQESLDGKTRTGGQIKIAGAKTFILKSGVWTDSSYDPKINTAITTVLAYSDAHNALLRAEPTLGAYSALGANVLIVLNNGHVLKISDTDGLQTLDRAAIDAMLH